MNRTTRNFVRFGFMAALLLISLIATAGYVASASAHGRSDDEAHATLRHTPHGTALLFWNSNTHALTVTIAVSGLQSNTTHPAHIHMGVCATNGPIIIPLSDVKADAGGDAISTTTIPNVMGGIPATGWFINVHTGPTLADGGATPITCGDIINHNTSTNHLQFVITRLGDTTGPNQNASGSARITLNDGTLTVKVNVTGLVPGSMHAEHIHLGSCERQVPGNVMFALNPLVADANGNATATTVFKNVNMNSIPDHGWYVNVHFSTDLTTQVGFDPITCGDVVD
ncbi:MAG TPA: CHRD domain-containing protein [Ktedonobacteraceae bacterium]|nr:CHRD domain-containing protein [Ktedonobacteraceae bacterium]